MGFFDNPFEKGFGLRDTKRYINDFQIEEIRDKKGYIKKKARYIGQWFVLLESQSIVRAKLWTTIGLTLALITVYIWALLLDHFGAGHLAVMLPLLIGLFPIMYLLMGVLSFPYMGRPMRRDQYMHSFIRASRSSAAVVVCAAISMIAILIIRICTVDWFFTKEDNLFMLYLLSVVVLGAGIIFLLRAIKLTEKPNDAYKSSTT